MDNLCNKAFNFQELVISAHNWGAQVFLEDKLLEYDIKPDGRNVLLVTHELTRTGAPVAIYYFAKTLKENGDNVFVLSPSDGALRSDYMEAGIPQIVLAEAFTKWMVKEWISFLDAVIVCTTAAIGIINLLSGTSVPVLWWIHEANTSYHKGVIDQLPVYLPHNVKVYCGGERARASLRLRRPEYAAKSLLYAVPDTMNAFTSAAYPLQKKYTILSIGVQEFRKGQDILAEAYNLLDEEEKKKSRLVFVGRRYYEPIWEKVKQLVKDYPDNVHYISELTMEDLRRLEIQSDCLVCSSRDDPMPIVIPEMMMKSKTIITSEYAGQATYLKENECGYVYENNDPKQLANLLSYVINHSEEQTEMRKKARTLYEKVFSEKVFSNNAKQALQDTISNYDNQDNSISVIIPSYNGIDDLEKLIPRLKNQKRANLTEIILVDSESKDGSDIYAEEQGCKVIHIQQSVFSHSYARNLGASEAKGKYVLFMTQDALPEDDYWLARMAQPLVEGICVAVSCRQIPREDCDLYGRVTGELHAEYMLFPYGDRILTAPSVWEANNVRKNAQLDDVACMVNKEIYQQFLYRGDYAEDLDLGIRLIKSGFHLVLLNSAKVIHSHKRSAYYHLRRAIVDNAVVNRLLPGTATNEWTAETVVNRSISAYLLTQAYVKYIYVNKKEVDIQVFKEDICDKYQQISDEISNLSESNRKKQLKEKTLFFDPGLITFAGKLSGTIKEYYFDNTLFGDVLYFAANSILDYNKKTSDVLTEEMYGDFCDAFVKRLGTMIGIALTCYSSKEKTPLSKLIEECRKGI